MLPLHHSPAECRAVSTIWWTVWHRSANRPAKQAGGGDASFYPHVRGFGKPLDDGFPTCLATVALSGGR
ncbi:hypothetical protein BRAO375_2780026 [Bradyrhizobium sp. ORS 375]|nr:hypothetical protein BRAO375_2780026 [Bradyrhizobium sp. ORS 375]